MAECDLQVQLVIPSYMTASDVLKAVDEAVAVLITHHLDCPNVSVYGLYEMEVYGNNG